MIIIFDYKRLEVLPRFTKEKIISSPNSRTSPPGKALTKVKIIPALNILRFLCKNDKTSNSIKPEIKCTYFKESNIWFFFPFQLIPLAQFENMVNNMLHPLRMPSYVLGNYDVMFSAVDSCSRGAVLSLFCCTYLLHNYSCHRILHESLLKK